MDYLSEALFGHPFLSDAAVHVIAALVVAAMLWWLRGDGMTALIAGFAVLPLIYWTRMFLFVVSGSWESVGTDASSGLPLIVEMVALVALLVVCFALAAWSMTTRRAVVHPWVVAGLIVVAYALHYHLAAAIIANAPVIYE